jgi:DNA-binding LacI/PurR family transcriptional regulator
MEDVAARAGVSRALVSIVFRGAPGASGETRTRVMQAADELGYRPDQRARLLGSARSRTVGVVFGLQHEFHAQMVEQLYVAAEGSGYELALGAHAPSRPPHLAIASLLAFRCEAIVLVGPTQTRAQLAALAERTPVVVVAGPARGLEVDVVRTDDAAGAALAVAHLHELGHREIAYVDGGRAAGAAERRRGYRRAMSVAGLASYSRETAGGLTEEDGEEVGRRLLKEGLPSAVVGFNDHCAAGLVAVTRAAGVDVPGDLSVVGFDDSRIAALSTVSLTTVAQDIPALAQEAFRVSRARAEGEPLDRVHRVIEPRLVVRRTTATVRPATVG